MKALWKLYRAFNITQVLLVIGFGVLLIYRSGYTFEYAFEVRNFLIEFLVTIVVSIICINNILQLRFFSFPDHFSFIKRIFFWISNGIMLAFSVALILYIMDVYTPKKSMNLMNEHFDIWREWVMGLLWIFVMAINGLFIFSIQLIFFFKIQKSTRKNTIVIIEEIGKRNK